MFGNVIPAKAALDEKDIGLFNSYYCALCREIGKRSQAARLGLSYDMTFLALLIDSVFEEDIVFENKKRCLLHPLKDIDTPVESPGIMYAADMSVLLIKAKFDDDARDEHNIIKKALSYVISEKLLSGADAVKAVVNDSLRRLDAVEKQDVCDPDVAADCFAVLCRELFSFSVDDDKLKKVIGWLGYNIGRWTYLLDAWEDLEGDLKNNRYNPYKGNEIPKEQIEEQLYYTLSRAAAALDLLPVKRYKSLLENIVYTGTSVRQRIVFHPEERKNKNESVRGTRCKSE